ncbi:14870_t:CDS:1, partial [Gigaspora margarita]
IKHISYIVHTIQLVLEDKFNHTEINDLISKAKPLNNYINRDKYYEKLPSIQAELNSQQLVNTFLNDTKTC